MARHRLSGRRYDLAASAVDLPAEGRAQLQNGREYSAILQGREQRSVLSKAVSGERFGAVTARGFSTTLPALLATLLVLGGCDGCGRASPSAPSSASPTNPPPLTPAAAAPAALAASEVPSVPSSPESRTAVGAGLVVPATQIFEPSDLAAGERRPLL